MTQLTSSYAIISINWYWWKCHCLDSNDSKGNYT